jgi:hypothetical protein
MGTNIERCNKDIDVALRVLRIQSMTTTEQLEANRRNAKKSTGPRSPEGKARSRRNSWKHGLAAKTLIIVGECADDFDELRSALMDQYDPQSALECELVERIAGILWRLRRVPFFEAAIMDISHSRVMLNRRARVNPAEDEDEDEVKTAWKTSIQFGRALTEYAIRDDALGKLGRHETMLMNAFTKTLQALLQLQEKRANTKGELIVLKAVAATPVQ